MSPPEEDLDDPSTQSEEVDPGQRSAKRNRLPTRPQYYNPDPVARMFGRANEASVEVNGGEESRRVRTL